MLHMSTIDDIIIVLVVRQVTAGLQVWLHQPGVSAGHQDLSQRCGHHLSGRVWVPTKVSKQVSKDARKERSFYTLFCIDSFDNYDPI